MTQNRVQWRNLVSAVLNLRELQCRSGVSPFPDRILSYPLSESSQGTAGSDRSYKQSHFQ
jgi:hypothetical protein